jgi:hypothetical protein
MRASEERYHVLPRERVKSFQFLVDKESYAGVRIQLLAGYKMIV